jgi:hypothetical protein
VVRRREDDLLRLERSASHLNLWATRFDPERGQPVGKPFALTEFDSPTMVISPYLDSSELSVSARHAALTMLTVSHPLVVAGEPG